MRFLASRRLVKRFSRDLNKLHKLKKKRLGGMTLQELEAEISIASPEKKLELFDHSLIKKETKILSELFDWAQAELRDKDVRAVIWRVAERMGKDPETFVFDINRKLSHFETWFKKFYDKAVEHEALLQMQIKGENIDLGKINKLEKQLIDRYEHYKGLVMESLEKTISDIKSHGYQMVEMPYMVRSTAASIALALLIGVGGNFVSPSSVYAQEAAQEKTSQMAGEKGKRNDVRNLEEMMRSAEAAVKADPNSAEARYRLADAYEETNNHDAALKQLDVGVRLDEYWANEALKKDDKHDAAQRFYRASKECEEWGEHDRSLDFFKRAIDAGLKGKAQSTNKEAERHNNTGSQYSRARKYDLAIAEFNKALELAPDEPSIYNNLGVAYTAQKKYDEAISVFAKAIKLDPTLAKTYSSLGFVYKMKQMYKKSLLMYQKAKLLRPSSFIEHYGIGVAYMGLNQHKKAIPHFQEYLKHSKNTSAQQLLNECLEKSR